jgi:hypothetical protein
MSEVGPEIPASPPYSEGGKRASSWVKPARGRLWAQGSRSGPEVRKGKTTELTWSVGPHFDPV